jgi:hypothetical protein
LTLFFNIYLRLDNNLEIQEMQVNFFTVGAKWDPKLRKNGGPINIPALVFFFLFAFTLGVQFPLRIWWSSVGHPQVHEASPGVLLVMVISLLSMPDGSYMSVKCGRYLALPFHRSTSGMEAQSISQL